VVNRKILYNKEEKFSIFNFQFLNNFQFSAKFGNLDIESLFRNYKLKINSFPHA